MGPLLGEGMGKRGPKKTDKAILAKRGSWRAKIDDTPKQQPTEKLLTIQELNEHLDHLAADYASSVDLYQKIKLIPQYDPYKNADDYYFDPVAAARPIVFCHEYLKHYQGEHAGQPFILQDWQQAVFANLFGWKHKQTHLRRYRFCYAEMGIGNGKSMMGAAVALYLLMVDGENAPEVYGLAWDVKQACVVFKAACAMRDQSPILSNLLKHYRQLKCLQVTDYDTYHVLSSGDEGKHGLNAHGIIFDELHTQKTHELWETMKDRRRSRKQPLIFAMTTAGTDTDSICSHQRKKAEDIINGTIVDPEFLPCLWVADPKDDWKLESTWRKANPNLGISVDEHQFRKAFEEACNVPSQVNHFKRQRLCIWTEAEEIWLSQEKWNKCYRQLDEQTLSTLPCYGGLDLGLTEDLTALALWFPTIKTCKLFVWIPKEELYRKSIADHADYQTWARQGYIKLTEGNSTDYDVLEQDILQICSQYDVKKIAVDRAYALPLTNHLLEKRVPLVEWGQGTLSMTAPSKELERMVIAGELNHLNNPVLRYCASNAALKVDKTATSDACKPIKAERNRRIDAVVALVEAIGIALADQPKKSCYAQRAEGVTNTGTAAAPVKFQSTYAQRAIARG
jgi:phage terminase large subunit-like protein